MMVVSVEAKWALFMTELTGIVTRRFRKFDYEVYADRFPRCGGNRKGVELTDGEVSLSLGAEAEVTGGDILAYVPRYLRPPVVS